MLFLMPRKQATPFGKCCGAIKLENATPGKAAAPVEEVVDKKI